MVVPVPFLLLSLAVMCYHMEVGVFLSVLVCLFMIIAAMLVFIFYRRALAGFAEHMASIPVSGELEQVELLGMPSDRVLELR